MVSFLGFQTPRNQLQLLKRQLMKEYSIIFCKLLSTQKSLKKQMLAATYPGGRGA